MSSQTDERVDLSDLDLLDEERAHARCTFCQPSVGPLEPFIALCGVRSLHKALGDALTPPPNACPTCLDLFYLPCRVCGAI